jgi:hypothetical protein
MNLFKLIILSFLFISNLQANVELQFSKDVIRGEPLHFAIVMTGRDIVLPKLNVIDGKSVQEISSSSSTNIRNNTITKSVKKVYSLYSDKDFLFPSLTFIIDSKEYKTKEKQILISNPKKTVSPNFSLTLDVKQKDLYVGESFVLDIIFKYKKSSNLIDVSGIVADFDNFWSKQINNIKSYTEGDFEVSSLKYLLFPLKDGILTINPLKINAQVMEGNSSFSFFSNATKNIKIYSNDLTFNIKRLPDDITLIGNFDIKSKVDKRTIKKGESISFNIEVTGSGNIDDVADIKLDIKDATVYENKPIIKTKFKDEEYSGVYTKAFSIIPNNSLTIPAINLEYFDKHLGLVILKQTQAIDIKVLETKVEEKAVLIQKTKINPLIKTKEVITIIEKTSTKDRIIFFILGVVVSVLILCLYLYVINYKRKDKTNSSPLLKRVKKTKTKNELLKLLSAYLKINKDLDELIFKLEKGDDIKTLKKDIIKVIKELSL